MSQQTTTDTLHIAIFDLDGTLLNTIDDLGEACNYALQQCGYPTHTADEYPKLVGNGVNKLIERALPEGEKTQENVLRLREHFIPYYDEHNCQHTHPYIDIPQLLQALKQEGWLLAVASNKYQEATQKLVGHFFPEVFDVVFGEREGIPRKPDPQIVNDIVQTLLKQHHCSNCKVIYIGDSDVDMLTAKNAKVAAIACTWGFCSQQTLQQYHPHQCIDRPLQLIQIIDTI